MDHVFQENKVFDEQGPWEQGEPQEVKDVSMMGRDEKSVDPHQPEIDELWERDVSKVPVFSR